MERILFAVFFHLNSLDQEVLSFLFIQEFDMTSAHKKQLLTKNLTLQKKCYNFLSVISQGVPTMKSPTRELLNFVIETNFEDLPEEVVRESKRILLDSVGVAVAGLKTEKSRYAMAFAKRFGGPPESAIIGTDNRVSCGCAAFANGELINALDYNAFIYPVQASPVLIPPSLALGETVGASGKDILLSIALGCELSIRLGKALRGLKNSFTTEAGSEVGKIAGTKHWVSVHGIAIIAAAAGAARVMMFDQVKMSHAVGLAAHFVPIPQAKWRTYPRMPIVKYLCSGWASMAAVSAVMMAELGYTGDTTVLDGDLGFWRFFGSDRWDPNLLTDKLGQEWNLPGTVQYKSYPCGIIFNVALDCFIKIIDENRLMPKDIEKVKILTQPIVTTPFLMNREIVDHITAQFSLPYAIAAAANRVGIPEWQDPDTIRDQEVVQFMNKVFVEAHPDFSKAKMEDGSNPTIVEVTTKGKTISETADYAVDFSPKAFAVATDEALVKKFRMNTSKILSREKIDKAIAILADLEKVHKVSEVVQQITLG